MRPPPKGGGRVTSHRIGQAGAERGRRHRIIGAEGELQAAEHFMEAAKIVASEPQAIQFRYLNTLHAIRSDRSSTMVFPLPMELLKAFGPQGDGRGGG